MYTPQELLQLLKNNELPDYAQEKKSFLGRIFSGKDWYKTMELGNREINRLGGYQAQKIIQDLTEITKGKTSIFDLSNESYQSFANEHKELMNSGDYLRKAANIYISNNRIKELDYQYLRILLFLSVAKKTDSLTPSPASIIKQFPTTYQPEIALIFTLAFLKFGQTQKAIREFDRFRNLFPTVAQSYVDNQDWFNHLFLQEIPLPISVSNLQAMNLIEAAKASFQQGNLNPNNFAKMPMKDLPFYQKLLEVDGDCLLAFCKLLCLQEDIYLKNKFNKVTVNNLLSKVTWTEEKVVDYIHFSVSFHTVFLLPNAVIKTAENELKNGSAKVLDALWIYYPRTEKIDRTEDKSALKLLQNYAHLREIAKGKIAEPLQIISSGFEPVRPGYTQNIYKGMIPAQIRPFFQILREVGDVDIIKFYQDREKNHFVRFQIKGKQFDLQTTNGLGLTIMQPLNTLLFENGIPYQFVAFHQNGRKSLIHFQNTNFAEVRVTLINQECYEQFSDYFMKSPVTGFAQNNEPAPAFIKRIEEIKQIKLRTDLDQIDLKNDPKFTILRAELEKLQKLPVWTELLTHTLRYPLDAKPSKTWQTKAKTLVEKLGKDAFQNGHVLILEKLISSDEWFQDTEKLCALRGLTWLSRLHPGSGQLYMLQKIANKAYKKITGGAMNAKLGNIALETLANIGNLEAFGVINNIEAKAKYSVYKRAIASRKKKFTKLLKQFSPEELADRSVPTYQLVESKKTMPVGDCEAILTLDGFKVTTTWKTPVGKVQKSIPSHLKTDFAGEIKAVKAEAKSIVETLKAQGQGLEKSWLQQRTWSYENWSEFLLNHGLMQVMTERLIWIATFDNKSISFISKDKQTIGCQGVNVEINPESTLRLWHPALASVEETLAWRTRLFDWTIKQPFKQAFREVYLLTPAEEATFDHSNRFAGHHLKGNTLYSLGKNREWVMTYQEPPILKLPHAELVAVLNINGGVLYSECQTMDLHFRQMDAAQKGYVYGGVKVALAEVPPVILSEVMRDVDLFVAVAGLGVDPYFDQNQTGTTMEYWRNASFGVKSQTAMAEVRKDLLGRLLPMTKIGKKCSFEGNFLEVKGGLREYKINLGSGNILMKPNDQYLCIVPGRNARMEKKIWLPFEGGDQTLMVILAKAFLLAEDEKITDTSILRQINRK